MIRFKCFHGTSLENGQSIIQENHFRPSDTDSLRMGVGAYFSVRQEKTILILLDVQGNWRNIISNRKNILINMRFYHVDG